jgi:hypothetical protein
MKSLVAAALRAKCCPRIGRAELIAPDCEKSTGTAMAQKMPQLLPVPTRLWETLAARDSRFRSPPPNLPDALPCNRYGLVTAMCAWRTGQKIEKFKGGGQTIDKSDQR